MSIRTKKSALLLGCGLILAALLLCCAHRESASAPEITVLDQNTAAERLSLPLQTKLPAHAGAPCIQGEPLPYDETSGLFYLPQSLKTDGWDGVLTWNGAGETAAFLPDDYLSDKASAIEEGHVFTLIVTDGNTHYERHLLATGLPLMSMETLAKTSYAFDDGAPTGMMRFFDPDADGGYRVTTSYMTYRTRGNVSLSYPKHSYRVRLFLGNGKKNAVPLCGMGANSAWILNPLYTDQHRVRDSVSVSLWQKLCADNPDANRFYATFSYIEVLKNGDYYGLFGLMEPMKTRMEAAVGAGDVVYLGRIVDDSLTLSMIYEGRGGLTSRAADIEYPHAWTGESLWDPLCDYTEAFWFDAENRGANELYALIDADNVIDHALFTQLISNADHNYTNNYFFADRREDGSATMFDVPWDFNHTFGNRLSSGPKFSAFTMAATERDYTSRVFHVLCEKDPPGMAMKTRARWAALRKGIFSEASVQGLIEGAWNGITRAGALSRDAARWPDSCVQGDLSELTGFVHARLGHLDGWVAGLSGGAENAD